MTFWHLFRPFVSPITGGVTTPLPNASPQSVSNRRHLQLENKPGNILQTSLYFTNFRSAKRYRKIWSFEITRTASAATFNAVFSFFLQTRRFSRTSFSRIIIYYTTRGLKILDYTRRVARKHHKIVDRVVFPTTRRVIENFPSSSCIRVDYIMNKINK
jgi:hypothetical protein